MSEEQQDQVQQQVVDAEKEEATAPTSLAAEETTSAGKKRSKRKTKLVNAEEVMPRPSYWPIGLAVALVVLLLGFITHPAIFILGVILVIGAIIGWALERR